MIGDVADLIGAAALEDGDSGVADKRLDVRREMLLIDHTVGDLCPCDSCILQLFRRDTPVGMV